MRVEIEVGLENAARVKAAPQEIFLEEPPKGLKNPRVRRLLAVGGLALLVAVIGLIVYYHNRETTDDAQVDGHITPIASKIYGRAAEVLVTDNEPVKAGQVLVRIDPRDYEASLDQAKAQLALAESETAKKGRRSGGRPISPGRRCWRPGGAWSRPKPVFPGRTRMCGR